MDSKIIDKVIDMPRAELEAFALNCYKLAFPDSPVKIQSDQSGIGWCDFNVPDVRVTKVSATRAIEGHVYGVGRVIIEKSNDQLGCYNFCNYLTVEQATARIKQLQEAIGFAQVYVTRDMLERFHQGK